MQTSVHSMRHPYSFTFYLSLFLSSALSFSLFSISAFLTLPIYLPRSLSPLSIYVPPSPFLNSHLCSSFLSNTLVLSLISTLTFLTCLSTFFLPSVYGPITFLSNPPPSLPHLTFHLRLSLSSLFLPSSTSATFSLSFHFLQSLYQNYQVSLSVW